jgi:hypothetical protein
MAKKIYRLTENIEPTWDREYTQTDIHAALSWYNTNKNEKDAAKYLGISDANIAKNFLTLAWAIRMQSRGCVFTEKSQATIAGQHQMLKEHLASILVPQKQQTAEVISIQDRVTAKTDHYIGDMEGSLVDEFGLTGDVSKMNAYQWMVDNGVKAMHASKIAEYFTQRLDTLQANFKDPVLKEYYGGFTKKEFLNLFTCYTKIVADAQRIASNAKVARKPRKKKPVSFDKMVKNLKYLPKFDELKLQSVDPVKIIAAQQVWVYNVKTRRLGVYNASDGAGILVKGSALTNFDLDTSIQKTLRKPEATLKIITDGGKIALRKALDGVNSKPNKMNGRINKDTVILRVV